MLSTNYRRIISLALPMIGSLSSYTLIGLVDIWLVGHLGAATLAAVGLGTFAIYTADAVMSGLFPAAQSQTAFANGAKDKAFGEQAARSALILAAIAGCVVTAVLTVAAPTLFSLIAADPTVESLALGYFQLRLLGMPFETMMHVFMGAWMGWGRSRMVLWITLSMHVFNAALSYLLVFGIGFPEMGLNGAAIGSAASAAFGAFLYLCCSRHWLLGPLGAKSLYIKIAKIAAPACALDFATTTGWTVFIALVGWIGTAEQAVCTVVVQLILVLILPNHGVGMASGTIAGWSLGAGNPKQAITDGWQSVRVGLVWGALLGGITALFAEPLLIAFLDDPSLLPLAVPLLWATCALLALDSIGAVLMETLLGVAATATATWIGIVCIWLVGVPLTVLAAQSGAALLVVWLAFYSHRLVMGLGYGLAWQRRARAIR